MVYRPKYRQMWRRWLSRRLLARFEKAATEEKTYLLQLLGRYGNGSALEPLLDAVRSSDCTLRRFAVSALADYGDARALDALIVATQDEESDIRAAAVMALSRFREVHVLDVLIQTLKDTHPAVRSQAVIALGHFGSTKSLPALKAILESEKSEWIRRYASQAIEEIKGGSFL